MGYIYCITNKLNNKKYIGKTLNTVEYRWKEHLKDYKRRKYEKRALYDAMNKYGIENFIIEGLEKVEDESNLSEREIYWIQELQTYGRNGYNATKGGDGKILYDYNEIIELYNLGYNYSQISEKVGCCEDIIRKVLKANNIKIRKNRDKYLLLFL